MYRIYDKRVNDINKKIKDYGNKIPQVAIITKNDNKNKSECEWQIVETYHKLTATKTKTIYLNNYQEYISNLNNKTILIIDDIGLCM